MTQAILAAALLIGQVDVLPPGGAAQRANLFPEPNAAQEIVQPAAHEAPSTPSSRAFGRNSSSHREPLQLGPPSTPAGNLQASREPPGAGRSIATVASSLAIVLGLFFAAMWLMRRGSPAATAVLPSEVVEVLGRAALSAKQQMQLVRVGDKLVLLAVSATSVQTLTEICGADEVQRLVAACEATRSTSATATFRQVLAQLGNEPAAGGFFGSGDEASELANRARRGRRASEEEAHA